MPRRTKPAPFSPSPDAPVTDYMPNNKSKKLYPLHRLYFTYLALIVIVLLVCGSLATYTLMHEKGSSYASREQAATALEYNNQALGGLIPFQLKTEKLLHALQHFNTQLQPPQRDKLPVAELKLQQLTIEQLFDQLQHLNADTVSSAVRLQLFEHMLIMLPLSEQIKKIDDHQTLAAFVKRHGALFKQTEAIVERINRALQAQGERLRQNLQTINTDASQQLREHQIFNRPLELLLLLMVLIIALPLLLNIMLYRLLHRRLDTLSNYAYEIGRENYAQPPFRVNDQIGHLAMAMYRLSRQVKRHMKQIREHASDVENARVVAEKLANYDPLTGMANRRHFSQLLEKHLHRQGDQNEGRYLLFMDLDNFKKINDIYGHEAGDRLLRIVAARLKTTLRPDDLIARLGGDEFSMIINCDHEQIARIAQKILDHVSQPIAMNEKRLDVSVSIGITAIENEEQTVSRLLKQADMAMYQAKALGKNNFTFYSSQLEEEVIASQHVLAEAKEALANNEFVLHYQPKVDMRTRATIGCEALVRWNHPEKGLLPPDSFLPILEQQPLMLELERWVLLTACQQAVQWVKLGHQIQVAVNITIRQFFADDFVNLVQQALVSTGLPPQLLELEITETMLMDDIQQGEQILTALRQLGISVAVDDFGTGYSSLGYLQHLPLDCLKLDRSFVSSIQNNNDPSIIDAIISLGHRLNLKVVAEGVETDEQFLRLQQLQCDIGQGYLFSRPIPFAEFLHHLDPSRGKLIPLHRAGS